jgi:hypothetical protein
MSNPLSGDQMADNDKAISSDTANHIADRMDRKATMAQKLGTLYMVGSVSIGGVIMMFFLWSSLVTPSSTKEPPSLAETIGTFAGSGVLRIGMVLIAIFVIQILVGFARYYYRLSEHISFSADIIRLSDGNTKLIKELSTVLLPSFDFGKMPSSPFQKIVDTSMDTVRELAKKIPTK